MKYDYLENLKEDIKNYMEENDIQEVTDSLYDDLFLEDSVTGNASGSYYCNAWKAEEAICHNHELLKEAQECFGYLPTEYISKGAEWADVTIRCYLLGQALEEVKEEL
jgi:hypothetical protein